VTLPLAAAPDRVLSRETKRGNPDWPERQWIRWNDYGIGLLLQGDLRGASAAFAEVAAAAKEQRTARSMRTGSPSKNSTAPPRLCRCRHPID